MPYDALGNYIPGDDEEVARMRAELAQKKEPSLLDRTVQNLEAFYKMLPMNVAAERVKPLTETAATVSTGLAAPFLGAGKGILQNIKEGTNERVDRPELAESLTYMPRTEGGQQMVESLMSGLEASKLPPYVAHMGHFRFTPDDLRVAGKTATTDVRNFPADYANARMGLQREYPTLGSRAAGAVQKAEPLLEKGLSMYEQGSLTPGFQPTSEIVRKPGGQFVRSNVKPSELGADDFPQGSNFERMIADYYIRNPRDPHETSIQWNDLLNSLSTFDSPALRNERIDLPDAWNKFISNKALERYPDAPNPMSARKALTAFEQRKGTWGDTKLALADEFVKTDPEVQLWNSLVPDHKKIVSPYELQERNVAANQYIENQIAKYVQSQLGSEKDPMLRAAAQGLTYMPREELAQRFETRADGSIDFQRSNTFNDAQLRRRYQGFDEQGVMYPQLVEVRSELAQIGNEINVKNLQLQDLLPEVLDRDPVTIPGYLPLRTELEQLGRRKSQLEEKAYELETGTMYEALADLSLEASTAGTKLEDMSYHNRQFFPYLQKLPSTEKVYDITNRYTPLGLADLTSSVLEDIRSGSIPLDQIKNVSLEKYVRGKAETRVAKEKAEAKLAALDKQALTSYAQQRLAEDLQTGWAKPYGNAVILTIDDIMSPELVRRQLSLDTEILDHCVGSGGRSERKGRNHEPMVMPHTNVVPKNSHGGDTAYVTRIADKDLVVASVRDAQTGLPAATIELKLAAKDTPDEPTQYNLGYVNGYKNGKIDITYQDAIKHYLNENASIIRRASDYLEDNIAIYDTINASQRRNLLSDAGVGDTEFRTATLQYGDAMPRFMTVDDVRKLMAETQLTPVHEGSLALKLKNTVSDLEVAVFSPGDAPIEDLQSRVNDLRQRIERLPDAELTREAVILLDDMFEGAPPGTTIAEKIDMLRADSPADVGVPERLYNRMIVLLQDAQEGRPIPTLNQLTPAPVANTTLAPATPRDVIQSRILESFRVNGNAYTNVANGILGDLIGTLGVDYNAHPRALAQAIRGRLRDMDTNADGYSVLNDLRSDLEDVAVAQDAAFLSTNGANVSLPEAQMYPPIVVDAYINTLFDIAPELTADNLSNALEHLALRIADLESGDLTPTDVGLQYGGQLTGYRNLLDYHWSALRKLENDVHGQWTPEPPVQLPAAAPAVRQERFAEFNGDMNQTQARNRIEQILNDDTINDADIRELRNIVNDPDHLQFRNEDAEFIGELNDMIDYRLNEGVPRPAPARREHLPAIAPIRQAMDNYIDDIVDTELRREVLDLIDMVNEDGPLLERDPDTFITNIEDAANNIDPGALQRALEHITTRMRHAMQGFAQGGPVQRYAKGGIVKRKIHVAKDLATMKAELMKGR